MSIIEENIKSICKQKGLTMTDLANRICTSPSNLLSSIKGNPTVSRLNDIAAALQVSISDLLTMRPDTAQGIVIIDGQTFQISKPAVSTVQLPTFYHYDKLRKAIKLFISNCVYLSDATSMMGVVETMEVFSLLYDPEAAKFHLSLCYANGKTLTCTYDKLAFCNWYKDETGDKANWNLDDVSAEIISDIEGIVPMKLHEV